MIRIAVVMVNYRTAGMASECIASLDALEDRETVDRRVFVVDNDSGDGSYESLLAEFGSRPDVEVIQMGRNAGYAAGNNRILEGVLASDEFDYVWLLNPDTIVRTAVTADVLEVLGRPRTAALGARLEDPDETPQTSAFRFPSGSSEFLQAANLSFLNRWFGRWRVVQPISDTPVRADWLAGASLLLKVDALRDVGLFDERFFLYFEEVDLFRRLAAAGWESWYFPEMRVIHHVGASTGISDDRRRVGEMPDYWYAARSHYFLKQHGPVGAFVVDLCWLTGRIVFLVSRLVLRKRDTAAVRCGRIYAHNALTRSWRGRRWVHHG